MFHSTMEFGLCLCFTTHSPHPPHPNGTAPQPDDQFAAAGEGQAFDHIRLIEGGNQRPIADPPEPDSAVSASGGYQCTVD